MSDDDKNVVAGEHHQELNRRKFLGETGRVLSMALASAGVFYEFIDHIAQKPEQVAFADGRPRPVPRYARLLFGYPYFSSC